MENFTKIFQILEYKHPAGVYPLHPLHDFHEICSICSTFQDVLC